jgi:DNA invertase Pin-like site-specific DNA recombinase
MSRTRRAYSYVRFSSPQQAEGGSLNRQTALSQVYCQKKNLLLDDSLTLRDLGVSAFRGDNVRDGALAGFLEACRVGRVPKGSVLIVESLDRLSRDQIRPALQLFLALQDFGITIVTLQPEREYAPEATDALALIEPLIVFARAHEESAIKSSRRRDGWKQARDRARQGGGPIMKTCPAWLEVTPDGFRVKEEGATIVRRIFALCLDGLGVYRIAERLRDEGVPPLGSGDRWVKAYVYKILTSPAAMGTYQPMRHEGRKAVPDGEPITGFYPAVVDEEEWQRAQAALQGRTGDFARGRKGDEETNLFTGRLHCAVTGEKMNLIHGLGRKGSEPRKRYVYLSSTVERGVRGGRPRFDYPTFEAALLSCLRELRPEDITGEPSAVNDRKGEMSRLSGRLLDIDSRLERARQRARTAKDFDAFLDLIQELQSERKRVSEQVAALQQEEEDGKPADLGEAQSLIGMLAQAPAGQRNDLRRRLKARIRQLVSGVWVLVTARGWTRLAAVQVWFAGGQRRREYLILHRGGKSSDATRQNNRWEVQSLADAAQPGELDLRDPGHAARLETVLASMELT